MKNISSLIFNRQIVLLLIVCSIFLLILIYKLDSVPPGINGDEASIGYNAILISETFRDENKRLFPLFVLTLDGKDWKQPINIYSTVLLFKLFGASLFTLRFISVLFCLFSLVTIYLILKEIFDEKYSIIGLIFFLSSPLILIQSHLALENITPLPFICVWLLMIIKFFKSRKNLFLIIAGVFLGLGMYSYFGMRLVVPVYALLTVIFLYCLNFSSVNEKLTSVKFFLIGFLPFILLIFYALLKFPGAFLGNNSPKLFLNYQSFFLPYISSFDLSFLFLQGDITNYHSTGIHGMFIFFSLPFFLCGIYQIFKSKNIILKFVLLIFILTPILFGFIDQIHRASRLMAFIPFFVIICTEGAVFLFTKTRIIFCLLIFLSILSFSDFLLYYWNEYPIKIKEDFASSANITFNELSKSSKKYHLKPVILEDYYLKEGIAAKFFEKALFSKPLIKWNTGDDLLQDRILLTSSADREALEKKGFKELKLSIEGYSLFLSNMDRK